MPLFTRLQRQPQTVGGPSRTQTACSRRQRRNQLRHELRKPLPLAFEALEPRQLLAVTATFSKDFNILDVTADADGDVVLISHNGTQVLVNDTPIPAIEDGVTLAELSGTSLIRVQGDVDEDEDNDFRIMSDFTGIMLIIRGGGGDDILVGNAGSENLFGEGGDDQIFGEGGDDLISGLDGNDTLVGGPGNDQIYGGSGDDQLFGNDGDDEMLAGDGNDRLQGGDGDDDLKAGDGNDLLYGEQGDDTLDGESGDDGYVFEGLSLGSDTVEESPNEGEDYLDFGLFGAAINVDIGSTASQTINAGNLTLSLASSAATEIVVGSEFNDIITGNPLNNFLFGKAGNDQLFGEAGSDFLFGLDGDDQLFAGADDDSLNGGAGDDLQQGGSGSDTYLFDSSASGNDTLTDQPSEAPCSDEDLLDFSNFPSPLDLDLASTQPQSQNGLSLTLTSGQMIENVIGTSGDDVIFGNACDNRLEGQAGEDLLDGRAGDDKLLGGMHNDVLFGDEGDDQLDGNEGEDNLRGGDGNDTINGGPDDDTLLGGSGDDELIGDTGNDTLVGGPGTNQSDGGLGDDRYELSEDIGVDQIAELAGGGVDTLDASAVGSSLQFSVLGNELVVVLAGGVPAANNFGNQIENLVGSSTADRFELSALLAGGTGSIEGGGGFDVLDYTGYFEAIDVNLATGSAPGIGQFSSIETLVGSPFGDDELIGNNLANLWDVSATNAGFVNQFQFSDIENLTGGNANDVFQLGTTVNLVSGIVDGAQGEDTLDYSQHTEAVCIDLEERLVHSSSCDIGIGDGFDNVEVFVGSPNSDEFHGPDRDNEWLVSSTHHGVVNSGSDTYRFVEIEQLRGGSQDDRFVMLPNSKIERIDNQFTDSGVNTLDFSQLGIPQEVGVGTCASLSEFESPTITEGFCGINRIIGNDSAGMMLRGYPGDENNNWSLTGANAGTVLSLESSGEYFQEFVDISNIEGSSGMDRFTFEETGSLTGMLSGSTVSGDDIDELFYNSNSPITANLQTGVATRIGSIEKIENVVGGNGNDTIIASPEFSSELFGREGNDTLTLYDGAAYGGQGNDRFVLFPVENISVSDTGGTDRLDFSNAVESITLDLDESAEQVLTESGVTLSLDGMFEELLGSDFADKIFTDPPTSPRFLDGRNPGPGGTTADLLIFDSLGNPNTQTPTQISTEGFADISHARFEFVLPEGSVSTVQLVGGAAEVTTPDGDDGSITVSNGSIDLQSPAPILVGSDFGRQISPTHVNIPLNQIPAGQVNFVFDSGDDRLVIDTTNGAIALPMHVEGGTGTDVLEITGPDFAWDLASQQLTGSNLEVLDLLHADGAVVDLRAASLAELAGASSEFTIRHGKDDELNFDANWFIAEPFFSDGIFSHRVVHQDFELRIQNESPWQNPFSRLDVVGNNFVTPLDALVIINDLNRDGARELIDPTSHVTLPTAYLDTSGDGFVSPLDPLLVINFLNRNGSNGEGEAVEAGLSTVPNRFSAAFTLPPSLEPHSSVTGLLALRSDGLNSTESKESARHAPRALASNERVDLTSTWQPAWNTATLTESRSEGELSLETDIDAPLRLDPLVVDAVFYELAQQQVLRRV